jgi:hypothetical protein
MLVIILPHLTTEWCADCQSQRFACIDAIVEFTVGRQGDVRHQQADPEPPDLALLAALVCLSTRGIIY